MRKIVPVIVVLALVLAGLAPPAGAQQPRRLSFIRDAEIEHTIRTYAEPIFQVAGLSPQAITVYLVDDPAINAFVSGGQNLFINTGLLVQTRNVQQVVGVIAHETGHIAGGHLARGQDAMEMARRSALIGTLLGIAAGVAGGQPGAGIAVLGGGLTLAERSFLSFSRSMESSADQAGLSFMDRAGYSSEGLLTFLESLADQELVPESRQVEYVRTHPLTRDRIEVVRAHVARSRLTGRKPSAEQEEMFRRMQAKLIGFMTPQTALQRYPATDTSVAGRYARAIALYRRGDLATALALMDELIRQEPDNPYFQELKGQALLENGRLAEARPYYERAVRLAPGNPLLLEPLAQTKLESGSPADLRSAIDNLNAAVRADPAGGSPFAWRLLATAYGRSGDLGMAAVALAEEALAQGDPATARQQAQRAEQTLARGTPGWLRAQDIKRAAEDQQKR